MTMRTALVSISVLLATELMSYAQPEQRPREACLNQAQWDNALSMTPADFNDPQSPSWRRLKDAGGCEVAAADLVHAFRQTTPDLSAAEGMRAFEAELYALAGAYDKALPLFKKEYDLTRDPSQKRFLSATIAFLERDRGSLDAAYFELTGVPEPVGWEDVVKRFKENFPDLEPPVWPAERLAVEAYQRCFEKSYYEAVSEACVSPSDTKEIEENG